MNEGEAAQHPRDPHRRQQGVLRRRRCSASSSLTTSGWLTWYTKTDRYSRAKLNADLETLRAYYLNRGYLEFDDRVDAGDDLARQAGHLRSRSSIREGQPYTVTGGAAGGRLPRQARTSSSALVACKPGEPYRGDAVADTAQALHRPLRPATATRSRASSRGPRSTAPTARWRSCCVADPQRRVYVRRINVAGNTRTRDEVVRREFRQLESAWYDGDADQAVARPRRPPGLLQGGRRRDRRGAGRARPGRPDRQRRRRSPTGNLLLGAGYSSAEKLSLHRVDRSRTTSSASGNYLGLEVNTSKSQPHAA
ncbi:MAG: hypothetical protein MZW92_54695 [Comamonadaceae bacterium]|nr:hypothetical protein [Comamonadaceae bacterium]